MAPRAMIKKDIVDENRRILKVRAKNVYYLKMIEDMRTGFDRRK
jgi:hypothetical protein